LGGRIKERRFKAPNVGSYEKMGGSSESELVPVGWVGIGTTHMGNANSIDF